MILAQDTIDFFCESADTYRFLSQMMFKELTEEAIAELANVEVPESTGNAHLDEGYRLVKRYFRFSGSDRRSALACDYARTFLAAGVYEKSDTTAIPYESVFTSPERLMMQDSRDDVVRIFAHDGFVVNPALHEPEDHLSFELEYLAIMNERAAALAEAGDTEALVVNMRRQAEFLEKHLLNWLPALVESVRACAKFTFYPGMMLVSLGAAEISHETLKDLLKEVQPAVACVA